jgi:hypothetical protein
MYFKKSIRKRFFANVDKTSSPHGCWLWTGPVGTGGYGQFWVPELGRQVLAHRFAMMLERDGFINKKLEAAHDCLGGDNKLCVNPDHIKLLTHRQHAKDTKAKGQYATGSRHGSRLHPESRPRGEEHSKATKAAAAKWSGERHYLYRRDITDGDRKEIARLYFEKGWPVNKIAKKYWAGWPTVKRILRAEEDGL